MSFTTFPQTASLRNVFDVVVASDALHPTKKRDMLSALRRVGKAVGSDLEWISAEPAQLGRALANVAPAASGISSSSWSNIRSLVNKAVALNRSVLPLREDAAASPAWTQLVLQLEPRFQRYAILPGLKFLTGRGIEPDAVAEADLRDYFEQVKESLRKRPSETIRRFIGGWNVARESVPGWPDVQLTWESRRTKRTLEWGAFPASFQTDVEAWLARQGGNDFMAADGPPKPLKPITLNHYRKLMLIFASALVERGTPPSTIVGLKDLVEKTAFCEILYAELARSGNKKTATIARRADILISMARHYCKLDERKLDELRGVANRVKPNHVGLTDRNRARLRQFPDLAAMVPLLDMPFSVRRRLDRKPQTPVRDAQKAEAAVAVALLLVCPVRIQNLRNIEMGRHLVGSVKTMRLVLHPDEVKNCVPIEMTVPEDTAELITWFLNKHRRHLPGAGTKYLFGGDKGGPRSPCGLSVPIKKLLKRELGLDMNPHFFRHFAARLFLDVNPGQFEVVRQLLGHKTIATTMKFYASFDTQAAATSYQDAVAKLRSGGGRA